MELYVSSIDVSIMIRFEMFCSNVVASIPLKQWTMTLEAYKVAMYNRDESYFIKGLWMYDCCHH
jgi:hypothetical protein